MHNEMQIFQNPEFGSVRTVMIDGAPWFVGKDIAIALGYRNPQKALRDHVDAEDSTVNDSFTVHGTRAVLINESGIYSLVLSSRLPNAKRFKHWITSEVLPSLRKTGGYVMDDEYFIKRYAPNADEQSAAFLRLTLGTIMQLNRQIEENQPKVEFANQVAESVSLIDMNRMAKLAADHGIRIGSVRLFRWLRKKGILMHNNLPYQEYIERGYFAVKEGTYERNHEMHTYSKTLVTGKGQLYLIARLRTEYMEDVF